MKEHGLSLLVLSHGYAVNHLKRECEWQLEQGLNTENVVDIFQLALLCDASRLSLLCHRFMLRNLKPVSATGGWKAMKQSHPVLEKQLLKYPLHICWIHLSTSGRALVIQIAEIALLYFV